MITKEEFVKDLNYLKAYYFNWNFDFKNLMLLEIWYESLNDFTNEEFKSLIKTYCKNNQYPPNSPTDLLNSIPKEYSINQAWEIVLDILMQNTDSSYIYRALSKYPSIYKCMQGIPLIPAQDSFNNKCYGYCIGKPFKQRYQEYLDSLNIYYQNNKLVLTTNKNLLN